MANAKTPGAPSRMPNKSTIEYTLEDRDRSIQTENDVRGLQSEVKSLSGSVDRMDQNNATNTQKLLSRIDSAATDSRKPKVTQGTWISAGGFMTGLVLTAASLVNFSMTAKIQPLQIENQYAARERERLLNITRGQDAEVRILIQEAIEDYRAQAMEREQNRRDADSSMERRMLAVEDTLVNRSNFMAEQKSYAAKMEERVPQGKLTELQVELAEIRSSLKERIGYQERLIDNAGADARNHKGDTVSP